MLLRPIVIALVGLAVLASAAAAKPSLTQRNFELLKGSVHQTVSWHYLDTDAPGACRDYVDASGKEAIDYALVRPTPYSLLTMGKQVALAPKQLERYAGEVTRTASWRPHPSECGTCGGELGDCVPTDGPKRPTAANFDCGTRKLIAPQLHTVLYPKGRTSDDDLLAPLLERDFVSLEPVPNAPRFAECPPTQTGGPGLPTGRTLGVALFAEYRQLLRAKPGTTVTLKGDAKIGHVIPFGDHGGGDYTKYGTCPALSGPGRQVCETLNVELAFKRVR